MAQHGAAAAWLRIATSGRGMALNRSVTAMQCRGTAQQHKASRRVAVAQRCNGIATALRSLDMRWPSIEAQGQSLAQSSAAKAPQSNDAHGNGDASLRHALATHRYTAHRRAPQRRSIATESLGTDMQRRCNEPRRKGTATNAQQRQCSELRWRCNARSRTVPIQNDKTNKTRSKT